jgi:hypothetical protein
LPFSLKFTFQTVTGFSKAPRFETDLTLQTINVDGISLGTSSFTFPKIINYPGLMNKPTVITNLADYNYLSFDNVNKVTVN